MAATELDDDFVPDYTPYEADEPTIDTDPDKLKADAADERFYTKGTRGPDDVVLSGPIWSGWGPGRYFRRRVFAYTYLRTKYGPDRVVPLERQTAGRWAYLVKGLRCQNTFGDTQATAQT